MMGGGASDFRRCERRSRRCDRHDARGMLADLLRRENESWPDLLLRLNAAVMQCVVDGRVINELRL
jgi:hypothetical protein